MSSIAPPAHTRGTYTTDDWITPRRLIEQLGPFDLDPCESDQQPWPCAAHAFRAEQNGLMQSWNEYGMVWLNPPYGKQTGIWLSKLADHGSGIALVFARTETRMFFQHVWPWASAMLFLRGRLTFCYPDGKGSKAGHNSGGPSVLIGYGKQAVMRLENVSDLGAFVRMKPESS